MISSKFHAASMRPRPESRRLAATFRETNKSQPFFFSELLGLISNSTR